MPRAVVAWGLDVGNTALKAVKLRRDGATVAVEAFDVVEHDRFLTEPDVDQDEIVRKTLQKFLERNPVKRETVIIGVPGSKTFARFVKLPPVEPRKIPEIVKFEAIQQIPFPLEQVNWDYQTFTNADSPDVEVGIFAMKKELVAQVMSNFAANNMIVQGVQMAPLAVYNAAVFDEMTDGKGSVLLDIGAEHTDLIFVDNGRLWLRTINIGGNAFTDALSKSFKLPFTKAEALKKSAATSKHAKEIFRAMRPVFVDLVSEIQRSIGFYNSSHRDSRLERIIGMGTPFKLPNLQKYIQQELKMEVVRLENFRKAAIEPKLAPGLQEHILAMPGAYGLALQGLDMASIDTNLLPTEIARSMVWQAKRPWFAGAAALVLVAVGASWFLVHQQVRAFETTGAAQKTENDRAISEANKLKQAYGSVSDTFNRDLTEVNSALALSKEREIWPSVVQDVFQALPQAKNAAAAGTPLVIKTIKANYNPDLTGVTAAAAEASAPQEWRPEDEMMGEEGFNPGRQMNTPTAAGGTGTTQAERGFVVTITGYTPISPPYPVLEGFIREIRNEALPPTKGADGKITADPTPTKPYYYELTTNDFTGYTARPIEVRVTTSPDGLAQTYSSNSMPWGAQNGPFWSSFVPQMVGEKPAPETVTVNQAGGGGMLDMGEGFGMGGGRVGGGGTGSFNGRPMDPDRPGKDMHGYTEFTATLKVVLKNPAETKK